MDNKQSIRFAENNTKSILFASKFKGKNIRKLNIKYEDIQIEQHSKAKYLESLLYEVMSGEAMTPNVTNKIMSKA